MRTWVVAFGLAGCGASLAAVFAGCGGSSGCEFDGTCGGTATDGSADGLATQDGNGGDVVPGSDGDVDGGATDGGGTGDAIVDAPFDNWDGFDGFTCDFTKTPSQDPTGCSLDDAHGVFVSPTGVDGAAGTRGAPLKKIGDGIVKAKAAGKRVFVCAGTYPESLVVGASVDGVKVFGGLSCTAWTYAASNKVLVAPSAPGYALKVDALVTGVTIEDVDFTAMDATGAGASSIAVMVNASQGVVLRRSSVTSGNGTAGADGVKGSNYNAALTNDNPAIAGHDASNATGGTQQDCVNLCTNAVHSTGGAGGGGGAQPSSGASGAPSLGGGPPNDGAGGGAGTAVTQCTNGHFGTSAPGASGGAGAATNGTLSSSGWTPNNGADGATGAPAQGGGGGGGGVSATRGGGGGGGCGGCGGAGATAGHGGGSSFALVGLSSTVTLDACVLTAKSSGAGGKGGDGQAGQSGGIGGLQGQPGCPGGTGGMGGAGGGGGGGAGGVSAAIAYSTTAPTEQNATTKTPGTAGGGGAAGAGGSATAGKVGVSQAVIQF
jgi:hypothetical protein